MSNFIRTSNPATWQEAVKQLDEAKQQFKRLNGIMTPLEITFVRQELTEARERYRRAIENGVIGEHAAAVQNYQAKLEAINAEQRAITNSWDAAQLAAEMQVASMRIDAAAKNADLETLQTIYQEAKDSGDRVKLRAAAEALQTATARIPAEAQDRHGESMRRAVNLMQKRSADDLAGLRSSPTLEAAHQAAAETQAALIQAHEQIYQTAEVMDELAPNGSVILNMNLSKEAERIHIDGAGNIGIREDVKTIPSQPVRRWTEPQKWTEQEKLLYNIKDEK